MIAKAYGPLAMPLVRERSRVQSSLAAPLASGQIAVLSVTLGATFRGFAPRTRGLARLARHSVSCGRFVGPSPGI